MISLLRLGSPHLAEEEIGEGLKFGTLGQTNLHTWRASKDLLLGEHMYSYFQSSTVPTRIARAMKIMLTSLPRALSKQESRK